MYSLKELVDTMSHIKTDFMHGWSVAWFSCDSEALMLFTLSLSLLPHEKPIHGH